MTLDHVARSEFDFTTPKATRGGRSSKWTNVGQFLDHEPPADMLAMWLAQMDFQPAPCLQQAMAAIMAEGEYGYFSGLGKFFESVAWWYENRHGWSPDPAHMFATHGIGNAIGIALQAMTEPGDRVIMFSPVYNEFLSKVMRNGRRPVQSPLVVDADGIYRMNLEVLENQLTGDEKAVLFSAPHNPAGRVWEVSELRALAAFCDRHDLLLISDEIHHDLTFPGQRHTPTAIAAPDCLPRLIIMSAASKTFDIAGLRTGYVIIPDDTLRARFAKLHSGLDIQCNRVGVDLTRAAYTPEGSAWVDDLMQVLDRNRQIICDGLNTIPGVTAMPMQSTFLSWVNFTGTGMSHPELDKRIIKDARIMPSPGEIFGPRHEMWKRINIGAPTAIIQDAVERLQAAFSDLQ